MISTTRGFLQKRGEGVDDGPGGMGERLRKDDQCHQPDRTEAERAPRPRIGLSEWLLATRRAPPPPYRPRKTARTREIRARSSLCDRQISGRNSGGVTLPMNSTVMSGTPRQNSMKMIASALISSQEAGSYEGERNAHAEQGDGW